MMGAVEEEDETRGMASCVCLGLSCCGFAERSWIDEVRGGGRGQKFDVVKFLSGKIVKFWVGTRDDSSTSYIFFTVPG